MLDTAEFGTELKSKGFDFYTGVPCSFLNNLINYAVNDCDYVIAANEGDAVAIAAGAYFGARKPVVLMQNSGLSNAMSPLTSLNHTFELPVLGFVSLRGEPGLADEPQHELMGRITDKMLSLAGVRWEYLADDISEAKKQIERADQSVAEGRTFFFIVKKGVFSTTALRDDNAAKPPEKHAREYAPSATEPEKTTRLEALQTICDNLQEHTAVIATTGKTGRELYEIEDHARNLYMVGSMGCASSMGLGMALTNPERRIVVIDGDGALLMRLGALSSVGYYSPKNLLHIVLDNGVHDSTGGQPTVSGAMDFNAVATGSGYPNVVKTGSAGALKQALETWYASPELTFLNMPVSPGSKKDLGRPSITPSQVRARLLDYLKR